MSQGVSSLFRKFFMVDLIQGMKVTFCYQHPKEVCTEQYPMERPAIAERYRGLPRLNVNPDTGKSLCIACNLCALACPEKLISIKSERNPLTKHKDILSWTYDLSRCMFCGLCEEACPADALELSQDYEIATYDRQHFLLVKQQLEAGLEPTVYSK